MWPFLLNKGHFFAFGLNHETHGNTFITGENILDKKIIKSKGGIGTYKNESGFFNRQMIHFDSRGTKARWHR